MKDLLLGLAILLMIMLPLIILVALPTPTAPILDIIYTTSVLVGIPIIGVWLIFKLY